MIQGRTPRKAPWVAVFGKPQKTKPRYRIPQMSKHRHAQSKIYRQVVAKKRKEHPICQAPGCTKKGIDPHHCRGRAGALYTDERHIKMLCREHHDMCRTHIEWARSVGLLCEDGLWNVPDKS